MSAYDIVEIRAVNDAGEIIERFTPEEFNIIRHVIVTDSSLARHKLDEPLIDKLSRLSLRKTTE